MQKYLKAAKPKKDESIFKDKDDLWKFTWKGNECGYRTKADAEAALKKFREADKK